jgi:hypothetical protein
MKQDFMMKIQSGHINSYQDYYYIARSRSIDMALKVAENRIILLAVEQSEKPEVKEPEPLKPLDRTLEDYCRNLDIQL